MKKLFYSLAFVLAVATISCKKDSKRSASCNLPSTSVPADMVGGWANGYNSFTQIVDTYDGRLIGNAWQSGKYFYFEPDGEYAEFYYMANSGVTSSTATKAVGTVTFDENEGSFTFHCCSANYKGWQNGSLTVNRPATQDEVETQLTRKYYYGFDNSGGNTWMQIRFTPGGPVTSFSRVN